MWKIKTNWIFYFLCFLMLAVSCKTKKVQKTTKDGDLFRNELAYTSFNVPKATFTLVQKQNPVNVNGSVRIRKDSIIILSFQPFLGVEVARAGITRSSFTLVDRVNKRYFTTDFEALKAQTGLNINYNIFQSILTNSMFIFDTPGQVPASAFKEVRIGELSLMQLNRGGVNQEFNVDDKKRILAGRLFVNNEPYSIGWNYMNFMSMESGYFFPHLIKMTMSDGENQHQIDIAYSKVEVDKKLNFQFSVPSSYTQVTLEELLKILQ